MEGGGTGKSHEGGGPGFSRSNAGRRYADGTLRCRRREARSDRRQTASAAERGATRKRGGSPREARASTTRWRGPTSTPAARGRRRRCRTRSCGLRELANEIWSWQPWRPGATRSDTT
eukprot:1264988-Prymnesium_polylepis.1